MEYQINVAVNGRHLFRTDWMNDRADVMDIAERFSEYFENSSVTVSERELSSRVIANFVKDEGKYRAFAVTGQVYSGIIVREFFAHSSQAAARLAEQFGIIVISVMEL